MVMRIYLAAQRRFLHDDAGRPDALQRLGRDHGRVDAERRRQQGHLGAGPGPVSTFSLLPARNQPVELSRGGSDLPSRVADNLFWLGRYAERAEGTTRLLRGILVRLTEKSGLADVPELPTLLRTLTHMCHSFPGFVGDGRGRTARRPGKGTVIRCIFDPNRSESLAYVLQIPGPGCRHRPRPHLAGHVAQCSARSPAAPGCPRPPGAGKRTSTMPASGRSAGSTSPRKRPRRSTPPVGVDGQPRAASDKAPPFRVPDYPLSTVLDLLNRTVSTLAAFGGLAMESMTRGQGWRFLDIGRRLERCLHMIGLVRRYLVNVHGNEGPLLEALLEIADSSMTYRRRYLSSLQTAAVLDLVLADETNPRSLAFQLNALGDDVDNLPSDNARPWRGPEQRIMLGALTALRLADVSQLADVEPDGSRPHLKELLDRLAADLPALSDSITHSYPESSANCPAPGRHRWRRRGRSVTLPTGVARFSGAVEAWPGLREYRQARQSSQQPEATGPA